MSIPVARSALAKQTRNGAARRVRVLAPGWISLQWGSTTELVRWCDVISARSIQNHTEIATGSRTLNVRCPLRDIVAKLAPLGLMQIRREVAVSDACVRQLIGSGRHRLAVVLSSGAHVSVGRQFQRSVRARFAASAPASANRQVREIGSGEYFTSEQLEPITSK
jgi:DNA-binding LytR/AlgR family response regulator